MRVLLLSPEYTPELSGGVGTCVQELADALCQSGLVVTVVACTYRRAGIFEEASKTIHLIEPIHQDTRDGGQQSIVAGIAAFNRSLTSYTRALIAQCRPDVIHCQNWVTFSAAFELSREFDIPLVTTVHYVAEPIERWWGQTPDPEIVEQEKAMFRDATNLVSVSASMRDLIRETYHPRATQLPVVHNGINARRFLSPMRPAERAKLRLTLAAPDEKLVLFSGRLNPQKGISALMDAATIVLRENPKARLIIAGEADSKEGSMCLREKLERNPACKSGIRLLGKLPRKQLALLYQVADLAVIPSVYEPFGYAAIEAMSAGVPVVAAATGGLAEIVQHEQTGLLVPLCVNEGLRSVDSAKLASALLALLSDDSSARQFGNAGRERALQDFSFSKWADSMRQVYCQAIHRA